MFIFGVQVFTPTLLFPILDKCLEEEVLRLTCEILPFSTFGLQIHFIGDIRRVSIQWKHDSATDAGR